MKAHITQGAILSADTARLSEALNLNANDARSEIQLMLSVILGSSRALISACPERCIDTEHFERYRELIERRISGEPIAYLLEHKEFYGMDFRVSPDVLIPRPETELLVERVLERINGIQNARVLDFGTGSGIVAITLAKLQPQISVTAVDVCSSALSLARENALNLGADNISFSCSDWYEKLHGETFDLIISNPPYVAEGDSHLAQGDLRFEPSKALNGGHNGLECIRAIIVQAHRHLSPTGWVLVEHGYDQGYAVQAKLNLSGFDKITTYLDIAGIPRVTEGRLITQ